MNNKPLLVSLAAFAAAVCLAFVMALILSGVVERRTQSGLTAAFEAAGIDWATTQTDGLTVALSGTAPSEAARIQALRVAGSVVDASSISETIEVPVQTATVAPVFRIELMRHRDEVSVIGLVPTTDETAAIPERLLDALPQAHISDMLQSAAHSVPEGWLEGVDFALSAIALFDVGRISVAPGRIELEVLADGPVERTQIETTLRDRAPAGQILSLSVNVPRPVATPYLLRVSKDADGELRLGACSADTQEAQSRIERQLRVAGYTGRFNCPLALGAPSPRWGDAAVQGIQALSTLSAGRFSLSDAQAELIAAHDVPASEFDRAVGRLEQGLPGVFVLSTQQLDPPQSAPTQPTAPPEVAMVLSEEGQLSIEGRLPNTRLRSAVNAFARARFGPERVELSTRLDDGLPAGWSVRVLTGLEALSELHHGRVRVQAQALDIWGVSGNPDVVNQVTQVIEQGLGSDSQYTLAISYDDAFDPVAQAPTPDNCERQIREILAETKITFDPGSVSINAASGPVVDDIAELLRGCGELPFEVAGYTDSQGSEETNQRISQARAEAVVEALSLRRVLVGSLVARGYGPANPIADNGTAEGREANRRIEFTLIRPEPDPEPLDPAMEAELVFEVQTPDPNTVRPRRRPGGEPVSAPVVEPETGSDTAEDTVPEAPQESEPSAETEAPNDEQAEPQAAEQSDATPAPEAEQAETAPEPAATGPDPAATAEAPVVEAPAAEAATASEAELVIQAETAGANDPRPQRRPETPPETPPATAEN